MASLSRLVDLLWDDIAINGVRVPVDVWTAWSSTMDSSFEEIRLLAGASSGAPLSFKDANAINVCVNRLSRSFKDIRRSDGASSRIVDGQIFIHPLVKDLMAHYVGNDLYKIALMVDTYGEAPVPLPAEVREKILACLHAVDCFIIRLKAMTLPPVEEKTPLRAVPKILIVDDDQDVRSTIADFLGKRISCNIVQRGDGKEALELIDREEFQVVLLDQNMPGIDGFTILEHVRRQCPLTVVIMITGLGGPAQSHKVERLGGIYMAKPIALKALQLTIERELDKVRET